MKSSIYRINASYIAMLNINIQMLRKINKRIEETKGINPTIYTKEEWKDLREYTLLFIDTLKNTLEKYEEEIINVGDMNFK